MASYPDAADRPDTPRNRGDDDAPHLSPATPAEDQRTILLNEIAWGAVLAGVVVALVTQLLLNMLGLGIGIATLDPGTGDNPSATSLVDRRRHLVDALGHHRLAGRRLRCRAAVGAAEGGDRRLARPHRLGLHHAGDLLPAQLDRGRRARRRLQHGQRRARRSGPHGGSDRMAAAAPALAQVADPFAAIEGSVRDASGGNDPAALRDAAVTAVRAALTGDQAQAQEARERAAQAIARAQNIPIEEASARSPATSSSTGRRSTRHGSRRPRRPTPPHGWSRAGRCSASSPWRSARWRHGSAGARARSIRP